MVKVLEFDKINGNKLWGEAVKMEIANVSVAFRPHKGHAPEQVWNEEAHKLTMLQ